MALTNFFRARSKEREKASTMARLTRLSQSVDDLLQAVRKDSDGLRHRLEDARAVGAFLDQDEDSAKRETRLTEIEREMKFAASGLRDLEKEKKFYEMLETMIQHEIDQIQSR